ncbi:hypothetical protein [Ottowia sp.]|uniref:hypothetical protein n=1 Tax=Ottowia sp. TaxID=1898956 RepID=UPI0025EA5494|nr:hypothetical protein [Ottowia sp.]MBK6614925.1 hypothetical protein [Ottowia sp.]MBK6746008.1 hypothetical protein [Ottowia sp.]
MTQRLLRSVPVAILMTTALAWNLPATAQTTTGSGVPMSASSGATPAPAPARPAQSTPATGGAATGGSGLPADFSPAMPASAASAAPRGGGYGPSTSPKTPGGSKP